MNHSLSNLYDAGFEDGIKGKPKANNHPLYVEGYLEGIFERAKILQI